MSNEVQLLAWLKDHVTAAAWLSGIAAALGVTGVFWRLLTQRFVRHGDLEAALEKYFGAVNQMLDRHTRAEEEKFGLLVEQQRETTAQIGSLVEGIRNMPNHEEIRLLYESIKAQGARIERQEHHISDLSRSVNRLASVRGAHDDRSEQ